MRKILFSLAFVAIISFSKAQTFSSSDRTQCAVQVALAVSEGDNFGEYSITELISLEPGESFDFKQMEFVNRQIYSRVEFDEMFIVRFQPTGITHFLDATVPNGYEAVLSGGCIMEHRPFYTRDGEFIIDASKN